MRDASTNDQKGDRSDSESPRTYSAADVAAITGLAKPTIYERARRDPERWGLLNFGGRERRFRRDRIDALVRGSSHEMVTTTQERSA